MALKEEFESNGRWLFRWRSYLPLVILGFALLYLKDYTYPGHSKAIDQLWEIICLVVSFLGLGIRILTIGYTPRGTSGRNTKKQIAETLNTTGLYSIVRNPLYLGNYFMGFGLVLFIHNFLLLWVYSFAFWLYYERIIFAEEAFLRRRFGSEYLDWAAQTPVFIPKLRGYRKPSLSFSLRNVLKREYNGFFAVILVMYLLEVGGDFVVQGQVDTEPMWLILVSGGAFIWLTLRSLKKYTSYLDVSGR